MPGLEKVFSTRIRFLVFLGFNLQIMPDTELRPTSTRKIKDKSILAVPTGHHSSTS